MHTKPADLSDIAARTLPPSLPSTLGAAWAQHELRAVDFVDQRLAKWSVTLLNDFYAQPLASIPQASGTVSKSQADYEYFDNFSVEFQALMSSHAKATLQRV